MTLQEAIEFLEDMQPDACENCSLKETCDNAGTGVCVEALGVIKKRIVELERLRAENAKLRELVGLALKDLRLAADDNGGCYGCAWLDENEKCTSRVGRIVCDCKTNKRM